MPSSSQGLLRPYNIRVGQGPLLRTIPHEAQDWAHAFAWSLEQFSGEPVFIPQYYYLVEDCATKHRRVISELDKSSQDPFTQIGSALQARSWLEARSLFGLPLSVVQADLLNKQLKILEGK